MMQVLLFLYREVLGIELPWMENMQRAKRSQKLPVALTMNEVRMLLAHMEGLERLIASLLYLMANLLYGTRMRLMELLSR